MLNSKRREWRYPKIIAHRGGGKDAPENTIAAFELGAQHGYTMFECDVKFSKDKELFLLHDATLDRTTDTSGLAQEKSWQELEDVDAGAWYSVDYQGEKLAHFSDVISYILDQRFRLNIEVKPNPGEAYETGREIALYLQRTLRQQIDYFVERFFTEDVRSFFSELHESLIQTPEPYCLKNQFFISSFEPEALRGVKESVPQIPRALLLETWPKDQSKLWALLDDLDCRGVITHYEMMTPEFVEECHQTGRFVMVYTVNEMSQIMHFLNMGVDSVISDNMDAVNDYFTQT